MNLAVWRCVWASLALVMLLACQRRNETDGAQDHGHSHGQEETDEPEPVAITRWTRLHELFVEFPPPVAGKSVKFHAHLTRLQGFTPLTEGTFRVRFKQAGVVKAEGAVDRVLRAGIFAPEFMTPGQGRYEIEMQLEQGGKRDTFDCGTIDVGNEVPPSGASAPSAALSFLKETQWRIEFATAWAAERALAKEVELPAIVEPAGSDQLVVGAPTGGRFFHNPRLALAEGTRLKKGDVVGTVAPTVAGEDFSRLRFAVEEARLAKEQVEREIARVEPLVKQELLPERRLIELKNERETQAARLSAAKGRVGRVFAPGGAGGLPIKSTLEGVVSQVLAPNGEPVEAGAPLVRVGGTSSVWIRARFVARPSSAFENAKASAVRLASGERLEVDKEGGRLLSALPVIDAVSRTATWVAELPPRESSATRSKLPMGAAVVLVLRVGTPRTVVTVPRSAVVEINTRPYVFVQTEGESFEKRAVSLGVSDGGFVEVLSGVKKGERIVTDGGFDIHLQSLLGTIESHRH